MFPLGHIGFTAFLANFLSLSIIFSIIGSQIPDLIDKPLHLLGIIPNSRNIGHTLFMSGLIFISSYIITKKKNISFSLAFGSIMHLFEDIPYFIPWFYPFIGYAFPHESFSVKYRFVWFLIDIIGLILLFYVYNANLEFRKNISNTLNELKNKLKL